MFPVADRHKATHPHAFPFRRGDLIADALSGYLSFELCERQQDVERETAHRGGGIELLRYRYERDAVRVEDFHHACKVRQRARKPVNFVHHDDVDQTLLDIDEQPAQRWSLHRASRKATVVISCVDGAPTLAALAGDERFARLSLRM